MSSSSLPNTNNIALDDSTSDFDRSFQYYEQSPPDFPTLEQQSNISNHVVDTENSAHDEGGDSSYETDDFPDKIASARTAVLSALAEQQQFVRWDAFSVFIREDLSAMYNDTTTGEGGSMVVTGYIYLQTRRSNNNSKEEDDTEYHHTPNSKDTAVSSMGSPSQANQIVLSGHDIQAVHPIAPYCSLHSTDASVDSTGFVLQLNAPLQDEGDVLIAKYTCSSQLRPVPLLVQTGVQQKQEKLRLGIKLQASPHNPCPLRNVRILLAVPPQVDGERFSNVDDTDTTTRMQWDDMKRTLAWSVIREQQDPSVLEPGQAVEYQLQFPRSMTTTTTSTAPILFPLVVQAEQHDTIFSALELTTQDGQQQPQLRIQKRSTILHRKVS